MNQWQERFSRKVESLRAASRERFDALAVSILSPLFQEYSEFVSRQGLSCSAPLNKPGLRSFRFGVSENAYLLLSFRVSGPERAEFHAEFSIPGRGGLEPINESVSLSDLDAVRAKGFFESSLDRFLDALVEGLPPSSARRPALIGA